MPKRVIAKSSAQRTRFKKSAHTRHIFIFVISILIIGFMLWQVLLATNESASAHSNWRLCRGGKHSGTWFPLCFTKDSNACGTGCSCIPFKHGFKFGRCLKSDGSVPPPCAGNTNGGNNGGKGQKQGKGNENENEPTEAANGADLSGKNHGTPCPTATPGSGGGGNQPTLTPGPVGGGTGTGTIACGKACTKDSDCATGFCNPSGFAICPTSAPGQPIEQCQFLPPDPTAPSFCAPMTCKADNSNPANCACPAGGALRPR